MLNAIKKSINMKNWKAMFAKYGNKKKERKSNLKFVGNQMMFDHPVYAKYRLISLANIHLLKHFR